MGPLAIALVGGIGLFGGYLSKKMVYDGWEELKSHATFTHTRRVMSKTGQKLDKIENQFETKIEERRSCRELLKNLHDDIKCQLGMVPVSQHQLAH